MALIRRSHRLDRFVDAHLVDDVYFLRGWCVMLPKFAIQTHIISGLIYYAALLGMCYPRVNEIRSGGNLIHTFSHIYRQHDRQPDSAGVYICLFEGQSSLILILTRRSISTCSSRTF